MNRERITNSRLRSFARCRRLHHYSYNLLRRPIAKAEPLTFGTLGHTALEHWWAWFLPREGGGKRHPTPLDSARIALAEALAGADAVDPFTVGSLEALIAGYDARWFDEVATGGFEVLAVEAPFVFSIVNPDSGRTSQLYEFAGKIDVLIKRDGVPGFVEHKFTKSSLEPGAAYWRRLRLDTQVSDYFIGAAELLGMGVTPEFCLYDVIGRPSLRPLQATPEDKRKYTKKDGKLYAGQREHDETPDEYKERVAADILADPGGYYARAEVSRLDDDVRDRRWDVWTTLRSLHEAKTHNHHPRNADACFDFGRECSYFGPCSRAGDIADDTVYYTAEAQHEELVRRDDRGW